LELKSTYSDGFEFILENEEIKDEQEILRAEVWRSGSNEDDQKWKKAKHQPRVSNDGTIFLKFDGLKNNSNYDVRVLCKAENENMSLLTNNKLRTQGKYLD